MARCYAIVLAGGSGTRMKAGMNKVLLPLMGKPVLVRSIEAFRGHCLGAVVVAAPKDLSTIREMITGAGLGDFVLRVVEGGKERQDSVWQGLSALPQGAEVVLIHDGARPLVTDAMIHSCLSSVERFGSGIAAVPVTDTIKQAQPDGRVIATCDRSTLRAMQTPQGFRTELILRAHQAAQRDGFLGTDDAQLLEHIGETVYLSEGSRENLKLTEPIDMQLAHLILRQRESAGNTAQG